MFKKIKNRLILYPKFIHQIITEKRIKSQQINKLCDIEKIIIVEILKNYPENLINAN